MNVIPTLHCPQCLGYGYNISTTGQHVYCTVCGGQESMLGFIDNDVVYWAPTLSVAGLRERQAERFITAIVDGFLFIIAILGICCLFLSVWLEYQAVNTIAIHSIFSPQPLMLLFWCSLLIDMFLYYRITRAIDERPLITVRNALLGFSATGDISEWRFWKDVGDSVKTEVSQYYSKDALRSIDAAYNLAKSYKHREVQPLHMMLALIERKDVQAMLFRLEADLADVVTALRQLANDREANSKIDRTDYGADLRSLLLQGYAEALATHQTEVKPIDLFAAAITQDQAVENLLFDRKVTAEKIAQLVQWSHLVSDVLDREKRRRRLARSKPKTIMNRAMTARPTKVLDSVSQDFTLMARSSSFMAPIGRDNEVKSAFRVLQEGNGSVLLVGESGVGKSTILQGIANLMSAEDVPGSLEDKRLVVTDPGALIAAGPSSGNLENVMQTILNEVAMAGNIIWAIEDIHTLLGAGSTNSSIDIGKMLMNFVSQGYVTVIGTTTTPEYQKFIEPYEPFRRRFQTVQVPEIDVSAAITVLQGRSPYIEARYGVFFTLDAIVASVELSHRLIKDLHLPAKAISIMEESAIFAREHSNGSRLVTRAMVEQVISEKTQISVTALSDSESDKLLHLEELLHKQVIGQDAGISAIAKALRRARQDLRDISRPIASLLFLGPTGVGKTETAKAIASTYFGSVDRMLRFDMSEYDTASGVQKLIGAAGQEGTLTEAVRRSPFSLILLDEFEKAHSDVTSLFLQVMEDGRLTDGMGRTADFTNAMILATSNAGTDVIHSEYESGKQSEDIKNELLNAQLLKDYFKTELLNRFDDIVVFTPLSKEQLTQVCELLLQQFSKTLEAKGIALTWTQDTLVDFAERGYDPQFGARPLRRLIQDTAQDAIAKLLLEKKIGLRDVVTLLPNGEVTVTKADQLG